MMLVGGPIRAIVRVCLVAPRLPFAPGAPCEQFQIRSGGARLDDRIKLIRLSRVFTLATRDVIHLSAARRERAGNLAPHPEEDQFRDVPEIESDPATI